MYAPKCPKHWSTPNLGHKCSIFQKFWKFQKFPKLVKEAFHKVSHHGNNLFSISNGTIWPKNARPIIPLEPEWWISKDFWSFHLPPVNQDILSGQYNEVYSRPACFKHTTLSASNQLWIRSAIAKQHRLARTLAIARCDHHNMQLDSARNKSVYKPQGASVAP